VKTLFERDALAQRNHRTIQAERGRLRAVRSPMRPSSVWHFVSAAWVVNSGILTATARDGKLAGAAWTAQINRGSASENRK
jgi:hypothetical protein